MDAYLQRHIDSLDDSDAFWAKEASLYYWEKRWQSVYQGNIDRRKGPIDINWYKGGKTNIAYNCLDRHLVKRGNKKAIIWEGNDPQERRSLTYKELHEEVCRFANGLKALGVKKGDTVAFYMPMVPELAIAVLACARIGAVHSVVFGGFSAEALAQRIIDADSRVLLTADGTMRGKKKIDLKGISDKAIDICSASGFQVERCVVLERLGEEHSWVEGRDISWNDICQAQTTHCAPVWLDAEDPHFILYTSGSTGKPKGVLHTVGGYMVFAGATFRDIFDHREEDIYWCTADIGWITGHSYIVYGPLLNGATTVMFEGIPTWPDAGRFWDVVARHKVTVFYTAPTAIRALEAEGDEFVTTRDRSTLRLLGSVGEPINPEAWRWYFEVVGESRCPIVDTWWQTETGGIMISPLPGATPLKPGSATLPYFGIEPVLLDSQRGKELEGATEGLLAMKRAWPGMARTIYGDHKRYEEVYFRPQLGYYFTGDGCRRDKDGYYWITGRVDDVLNISGHRMGTAEVESALVSHPAVTEAAVVGFPHPIKGEGIYAFVTLMADEEYSEELKKELVVHVREEIGPFAAPETIHWAPALPKTRSGKIMRRILRLIAKGEKDGFGDTSTLADPAVIDSLLASRDHKKGSV